MKFVYWLVRSSEDASKWSRTVKSALPLVISLGAIFNLDLSWLPEGLDFVVDLFVKVSAMASAFLTAYYFFAKVKLTLGGRNAVLNNPLWK